MRRAINGLALATALAAAPVQAVELPGTGGKVEVGGWVGGSAIIDTGGGPREYPWARSLLDVDADLGGGLSLALELRGQFGGPYRDPTVGFDGYAHAFQNYSPAFGVNQAYLGWRLADADVRAGIQVFAWGKLDGIPPTDLLNPRSYHDPIVDDSEERKIGVPALAATYYAPLPTDGALSRLEGQLVYVPFAVPPRLALERERWFPTTVDPGGILPVPVEFSTENDPPARTLDQGGLGFRIGGTWYGADWDGYYYMGPETQPDAKLTAVAFGHVDQGVPQLDKVVSQFEQAHDTIHMVGADTAFVVGPVSVRAEVAYFLDRPYLRPGADVVAGALAMLDPQKLAGNIGRHGRYRVPVPPLFVDLDAVEWGIGADMVWEGFHPLVQLAQVVPVERAPPLLIGDPDTRLTAVVSKPILQERVELEVRTVYAIESGGWFALPRVSYVPRDDLRLRVGYLAVGGHRESLIGQFKSNDEVVFDVRWSF